MRYSMLARVLAVVVYLSLCLSVVTSQHYTKTVKRIGSRKQRRVIAQGL